MKTYTFIYDTENMKNVEYSFKANSMEDAKKYVENNFDEYCKNNGKIIEDGYEVVVVFRTGNTVCRNYDGVHIDEYEIDKKVVWVNSADELFEKFNPLKKSENISNAVNELLSGKRDKVEYNFGKGNASFRVNR